MKWKRPQWPKKSTVIKMEPKKDIFDLFKENEHKLAEQPAPRVWRRLERKLDNSKKRSSPALTRPLPGQMGVAAAILLLFTVVTIMVLVLPNKKQAPIAQTGNMVFEELSASEDDQALLKVVEFTRKHESRLANPQLEGEEQKIILPARSTKVFLLNNNE